MSNKRVDRLEVGGQSPTNPNDEVVWINTDLNEINRYDEDSSEWVSLGGTSASVDLSDFLVGSDISVFTAPITKNPNAGGRIGNSASTEVTSLSSTASFLNGYSFDATKWLMLFDYIPIEAAFEPFLTAFNLDGDYTPFEEAIIGYTLTVSGGHPYDGEYLITGAGDNYDALYIQLNNNMGPIDFEETTVATLSIERATSISQTELSYLDGATSNIQAQLDAIIARLEALETP